MRLPGPAVARSDTYEVEGASLCSAGSLPSTKDRRNVPPTEDRLMMALATLALGMAMFALFFGLVAACDRL